jgi:hypothetical protein
VNASEVNWQPWSLLKISGRPKSCKACPRQSTQNPPSSVFDTRQASTLRERQSTAAARQANPRARRTVDGDQHEGPYYLKNPFTREPDWAVTSINLDLQELLARAE